MTRPTRRPAAPAADRPSRWTEYRALRDVVPANRNPKRHDLPGIVHSIKTHGFADIVTLDERTGRLISGHGRLEALAVMRDAHDPLPDGVNLTPDGDWSVPISRGWASRDDSHADAYLAAANRLTELGGWDDPMLLELLGDVDTAGLLDAAGYTRAAFDQLAASVATKSKRQAREDRDPDVMPDAPTKPRTRPGDVWLLGPHRLVCGDSTDPATIVRALDGAPADLVFTSPPYNVGVDYDTHDDRPAPWPDYAAFLRRIVDAFLPSLADGRAVCWNIGTSPQTYPHRQYVLLEQAGLTYLRTLVWQKVGVPVPLWHNTVAKPRARVFTPNYTHEVVAVFAAGETLADPADPDPTAALAVYPTRRPFDPAPTHEFVALFANGDKLRTGRAVHFNDTLRNDVFSIHQSQAATGLPADPAATSRTGASSGLKTRAKKGHPAAFPVALPEAYIVHLSDVGARVLDPFGGSASTLLACHYSGRVGSAVELAPKYCDVAAARWQRATDDRPILERDGRRRSIDFGALLETIDEPPQP